MVFWGTDQIKYKVNTPIPKQFLAKGTLTWKAIEVKNKNYDAIVCQNFFIPLKTKSDNENRSIEILGNKIFFEQQTCPYIFDEIYNLEYDVWRRTK